MVKHIVMWKLRNRSDAASIRVRLESLAGRIEGLSKIEVGIDFLESDQSADLVLYAEFENRQALEVYQNHPEHQAVIPMIRAAATNRMVVDYES